MNDGIISGALQFIAVGAPSLITLWDKTKDNVQVKGMSAMTTYPLYLNVRNPEREVDQGLHRQGQDRGAVGQDLDAGDHAADGGGEAVRRAELRQVRSVDRRAVASRRAARAHQQHRRRRRAFRHVAVSRAGDEDSRRPDADHQLRDPRRAGDRAGDRRVDEVSRRQSEDLQGVLRRAEGSDRHASTRTSAPPRRSISSRRRTPRTASTTSTR